MTQSKFLSILVGATTLRRAALTCCAFVCLLFGANGMAVEYATSWRKLTTSNAPGFREWSAMTWAPTMNRAIMWGGAGGGAYLNDLTALDTQTGAWTTLDPNDSCIGNRSFERANGSDESGLVYDSINNGLWLWNGGRGYTCESQPGFVKTAGAGTTTLTIVDPTLTGDTDDYYKDWLVRRSGSGATAQVLSYTAATKTLVLAQSIGVAEGGLYNIYADFGSGPWYYDIATGTYTKLMARHFGYTGFLPGERRSPGFAAHGSAAFLFGGGSNDSSLYRLDFATKADRKSVV